MNSTMKYIILIAGALILASSTLVAQDIPGDTVNVVGRHRPIIRDAEKMRLVPQIDDTSTVRREVQVGITPKLFTTQFTPKEIKPAGLSSPDADPLKKGYAKLGFGNYMTPYGELFYNTGRSKNHQSGLHLKHLSSTGEIDSFPAAGYSHNQVAAWTNQYLRNHTLRAKVMYDRDMVHFYGFRLDSFHAMEIDPENLRQVYHVPGVSIGATNEGSHSKLYYTIAGDYHYLTSTDSMHEHLVMAKAEVFGEPDLLKSAKNQKLGAEIEYVFQHSLSDTIKLFNSHHAALRPFYKGEIDEFRFKVGFQIWLEADTASAFKVFPDIDLSLSLIDKTLAVYAGVTGGILSNNLYRITKENPFISRELDLESSIQKYKVFGGVKASIGRRIDAVVHMELANYERLPFYVTDTAYFFKNRFKLEYDEDVNASKVGAEVYFHANSKMSVKASAYYFGYGMTHLAEAWHKPSYQVSAGAKYVIGEKIYLSADFILLSPMKAPYYDASGMEQEYEIPLTTDLNIEAEYRFGGGLSAFIMGTNLLMQQQYRFYEYPTQKLRVLGGIAYSM